MSATDTNYVHPQALITPYSGGAYAAGQMIGGSFVFDLRARWWNSNGGFLADLVVLDNDLEGAAGILYLFSGTIATYADRAVCDSVVTYADWKKCFAKITLGTFDVYGNAKRYQDSTLRTGFMFDDAMPAISGILKATAAPVYAANKEIAIQLGIIL